MSKRYPSGFISAFYDPLKNPNAPTIGVPVAGDSDVSVVFTAPTNVGGSAITSFTATSNTNISASSSASPITVSGLTNGSSYTFTVFATNSYGPSAYSGVSASASPFAQLAVFAGGAGVFGSNQNFMQYRSIASLGDFTSFGTLGQSGYQGCGLGSTTRGIFAGLYGDGDVNNIYYITFATTGNATNFGDMAFAGRSRGACNSSTRGIFAGGATIFGGDTSEIEYITIASTGNGTSFGNLTGSGGGGTTGLSSPTRGVFTRSVFNSTPTNIIEYITIASTGNATDFGDLTVARTAHGGGSNSTRGVFSGGGTATGGYGSPTNVIDYITIASTGNATDFGDMVPSVYNLAGASSSTRVLFAGATNSAGDRFGFCDYITIASTGNSLDFGGFSTAAGPAGCSNVNGGVQ